MLCKEFNDSNLKYFAYGSFAEVFYETMNLESIHDIDFLIKSDDSDLLFEILKKSELDFHSYIDIYKIEKYYAKDFDFILSSTIFTDEKIETLWDHAVIQNKFDFEVKILPIEYFAVLKMHDALDTNGNKDKISMRRMLKKYSFDINKLLKKAVELNPRLIDRNSDII